MAGLADFFFGSNNLTGNNFQLGNGYTWGQGTLSGVNDFGQLQASIADPNSMLNGKALSDFGFSNDSGILGGNTMSGLMGLGQLAGMGLQAYGGLQNYKLGKQALGLAKKQFNFQKDLANRNLANQAKTINNAYDNAGQVAAGMIGGTDSAGNFGFTSQDVVDKYSERAKEKHVDGSAI